jgi:hypothetical protein
MAKQRQSISKKLRFEVFKRDSFTCQYCGESAPTVVLHADHIHPVKEKGKTDLLNLITSCIDCNLGKGARLLTDDATVTKQKAQLDELQERREQIEMMLEWRNGLRDIGGVELDAVCDAWSDLTGYSLNDRGRLAAKKHIKKFGLPTVLTAIEKAENYLEWGDSQYTQDSIELAWSKVGGICRMDSLPEWQQRLYHIRNIARQRSSEFWYPQTSAEIYKLFEEAYRAGDSFEQLHDLALRGIGYRQLPDVLRQWIQESKNSQYQLDDIPDAAINAAMIDELQAVGELD